jgi:hypothetical protein
MKKKLLPLLLVQALLALGLSPAFGQSPWVMPAGAPNFHTSVFAGQVSIHRILPNVIWGYHSGTSGMGSSSGVLFMSIDNGQNWQTQGTGVVGDVDVLDGQHAWYISATTPTSLSTLKRTVSGINGFVTLPTPLPGSLGWSLKPRVHFLTATTGIALEGAGTVYRTTDGGNTWVISATIPSYANATNDAIVTKQSIANSIWFTTWNGAVLRTADGGLTWTSTADVARHVAFENTMDGLAYQNEAGVTPKLLRTADGGVTWTALAFNGQPPLIGLTPMPGRSGTYLGVGYRTIRTPNWSLDTIKATTSITRDRGTTWQVVGTDASPLSTVVALSDTEIWAGADINYNASYSSRVMLLRYSGMALAARNANDPVRQLLAYPNPTNGVVQLTGPLQGRETARLYDAAGRLCQESQVLEAARSIDLTKQPAGCYQLIITAPDGTVRTQRVNKF